MTATLSSIRLCLIAVGSLLLLASTGAVAQEAPVYDPSERAEFERIRRADPATGRIPDGMRYAELTFARNLATALARSGDAKDRRYSSTGAEWIERGPGNQGGRTRGLAVDRTNDSVILAGGVSGGLWRSTDVGNSWIRVTDIDDLHAVTSLVQDPRPGAENVWYYGTGEQRANSANLPGDGIFKSTDGGRTFRRLPSTVTDRPQSRDQVFDYVHRIVVDPSNPGQDEVYAACYGGIVRSLDGGDSWEEVLGGLSNRSLYTDVTISSDGILYATLASSGREVEGIFRSVDGTNWVDITPTDFPSNYGRIIPAIAPSNEDLVYFFAVTPNNGKNDHSLWVYDHNGGAGAIWEDRSGGLMSNTETYDNYCGSLVVHPEDEDVVFRGGVRLTRTTDGFRDSSNTTTQMGSGQHADQHAALFFPNDPSRMLTGHDGGISITENPLDNRVSWQFRNRGYATTQFYSIAIDPATEGSPIVIGGTQDNGTWWLDDPAGLSDGRKIYGADGGFCAIDEGAENYYTSYQRGTMFRSTFDDEGSRTGWARIDPAGADADDYSFIHPFTLDRADRRIMYLPNGRDLWRNNDLTGIELDRRNARSTTNWVEMESARLGPNSGSISSVSTSTANPAHRLYYGTSRGKIFRVDDANTGDPSSVDVSDDDFPSSWVNCIAVDPRDGDHLLSIFSSFNTQSIFRSVDAGASWEPVSGNLEENPNGSGNGPSVTWVEMLHVDNEQIYFAATTTGLYSTRNLDGMNTLWIPESPSVIGNVVCDMIAVRESDGTVAVATHGRGIFTADVGSAIVPAEIGLMPGSLAFDTVLVGEAKVDTAYVTNRQSSQRPIRGRVGDLSGGDNFSVLAGSESFELQPGETHAIIVECRPTETGLLSGTITVTHDASSPSGPRTIFLSARGRSLSGVERTSALSRGLTVSPSPVASLLTVTFSADTPASYEVVIVDELGREVRRVEVDRLGTGDQRLTIDVEDLPQGAYRLTLNGADGMPLQTRSFVVRR